MELKYNADMTKFQNNFVNIFMYNQFSIFVMSMRINATDIIKEN